MSIAVVFRSINHLGIFGCRIQMEITTVSYMTSTFFFLTRRGFINLNSPATSFSQCKIPPFKYLETYSWHRYRWYSLWYITITLINR